MNFSLNYWDMLLIVVVALQSTVLAYIYHPEWKAFLLTLPFPFTLAVLAVGRPVNFTNMLGLILLAFFIHGIRISYGKYRVNIFVSIFISAAAYCLVGAAINRFLPDTPFTFWISALAVFVSAVMLAIFFPKRSETGYRSSMPVTLKLIIIMTVVLILVIAKKGLGGFMTVFPMVGVIAAYESRNSLWTMSRQISFVMFSIGTMIMAIRIVQGWIGIYWALAFGWLVFLSIIIPYVRSKHRRISAKT